MTAEASSAMQYWQNELATREEGTKQRYQQYFNGFLSFVGKTPDELIVQRQQDLLNLDRKIQRRIESLLLAFLAKKKARQRNGCFVAMPQTPAPANQILKVYIRLRDRST